MRKLKLYTSYIIYNILVRIFIMTYMQHIMYVLICIYDTFRNS